MTTTIFDLIFFHFLCNLIDICEHTIGLYSRPEIKQAARENGAVFKNYLMLEKLISKRCFKKFYRTLMNTCKFSTYFHIFHTNTRSLRSLDVWHGKYGNSC